MLTATVGYRRTGCRAPSALATCQRTADASFSRPFEALRVKQICNRVSETASLSGPGSHLAVGGGRAVLRHGLEGPPGERHRKGTGSCESRRLFCG